MKGSRVLVVAFSLSGAALVGCDGGNGCPNGYEVAMGMCVPAGSVGPDAAMPGDAGMPGADDAWQIPGDDAAMPGSDAAMPAPDAAMPELVVDAAMPSDAGCPYAPLFADRDGDGYGDPAAPLGGCVESRAGHVRDTTDCNDACASCYPGGTETCNGQDDDCDAMVDDGVLSSFYVDADGDGFGTGAAVSACTAPAGHSAATGDCNDGCASCRPGGTETCNGADDDCDGTVDDGVTTTFYLDADGDTWGRSDRSTQACTQPAGHAARSGDCDDASSTASPGASEICDGRDNDCDGVNDDGVLTTYYRDADGDSYGRADMTMQACTAPAGYVSRVGDCNDGSTSVQPGGAETCNDVDDDCDGSVDDGLATATYYADCDRDGYSASAQVVTACRAPTAAPSCGAALSGQWLPSLSSPQDCADYDARAFPGQTTYFTSPITGTTSAPGYDFNCDGTSSQQFSNVLTSCSSSCSVRQGWTTAVPACGSTGSLMRCSFNASLLCVSSLTPMATQACR